MKKTLLTLLLSSLSVVALAQFSVGHKTITYNDPSRTGGFGSGGGAGRQIQCEVYYPATSAGDNTPIAAGTFPVISFGHGFVMGWDAYTNIWEHYIPQGYIMIFPRTEGSLSPTHSEFGKDLVSIANRFETDAALVGNFFNGHWNGKKAVMGHSMGGGSSFLAAAELNASFDVVVGLAPAETNPIASGAAASVDIPTLILSGSGDAVTPAATHHQLIYNGLPASICKHFVSITGGAHCYFANSNFSCDFGEGTSGGAITITRPEQHTAMFDLVDPYLKFHLKSDCSQWTVFSNMLNDSRFVTTNGCSYTLPTAPSISQSGANLTSNLIGNLQWNFNGSPIAGQTATVLNTTATGNGSYTVTITDASGCSAISNTILIGPTGIEESQNTFEFFPNPATNNLTLSLVATEGIEIQLLDVQGRKIETIELTGTYVLDVSKLTAGIYYLSSSKGLQKRFIKQ